MPEVTAIGLPANAALGFRAHSGWAAAVVLAAPSQPLIAEMPALMDRRRIELIDRSIRGAAQPYHAAAEMGLEEARKRVRKCADRALAIAQNSIRIIIDSMLDRNCRVVACGIVLASGRPLPGLSAVLGSHSLIHTAEGELFREALRRASGHFNLPVIGVPQRDLYARAAMALSMEPDALGRRIKELGKLIGPPWGQDEKSAALVAWLALSAAGAGEFAATKPV
jgi:hypothetical protein